MRDLLTTILLGTALALGTAGCRQEGGAEKAGKEIDKAMEEARGEVGEAMGEASEALEEASRKMESERND